jgi:enoyl-CoA hydratase/carnithine racemase
LFGPEIANELEELVVRVDHDPSVDAVVLPSEVLLGINPGGGGTQRLTRLIATHRSLVAILEGTPFTPAEALANGAVDEIVPQEKVVARLQYRTRSGATSRRRLG